MRGVLALAVAVIAFVACGGDGIHVEIRVPGDLPVTRVDLFLTREDPCTIPTGPQAGEECQFIAPPRDGMNRGAISGELYQVDDPAPFHSLVEDGSAWFYLSPNTGKVKTAIAVGRDDNGSNVGVVILEQVMDTSAGLQYFSTELRAAAGPLGAADPSVELWPRDLDAPYACVAAVVDDRAVAIVPANDPDCDFVDPALECRPTIHNADEPAATDLAGQNCANDGLVASNNVCLLGARACNETDPAPTECALHPARFCVPDAVCDCPVVDQTCIKSLQDPGPNMLEPTRIVCTIPVVDRMDGTVDSCIGDPIQSAPLGTGTCDPIVEIGPLDHSFAFQQLLDADVGGDVVSIHPFADNTTGCTFSLDPPDASFANTQAFPATIHLLAKISIDPTVVTRRVVLVPLEIQLDVTAQCAGAARCELLSDPNERLLKCFAGM